MDTAAMTFCSKPVYTSISAAKSEAAAAFGNAGVYLEKYIQNPRHIEFQVLVDKFGNVIHFGDLDCSIQVFQQQLNAKNLFLKSRTSKMEKLILLLFRSMNTKTRTLTTTLSNPLNFTDTLEGSTTTPANTLEQSPGFRDIMNVAETENGKDSFNHFCIGRRSRASEHSLYRTEEFILNE